MTSTAKCRVCRQPENLAEPFIDGTCGDCLRKQNPQPPPPPARSISSRAFKQLPTAKSSPQPSLGSQYAAIPNVQSSGARGPALVVLSGVFGVVGYMFMGIGTELFHDGTADPAERSGYAVLWFVGLVLVVWSSMAFTLGMLRWAIVPAINVLSQQNTRIILLLEQIARRPNAGSRDDGAPASSGARVKDVEVAS